MDKPSEDLRSGDTAEIGTFRGRDGVAIAIPAKRTGKTGVTKITIQNNMTDQTLQRRFKQQAQAAERGHHYSEKYDVNWSECGVCLGSGERGGKDCPKCKGQGEIERSLI
jgi:DnaJ-class molecular chaperone